MNVSNARSGALAAPVEHVRLAGYPGLVGFAVVLTSMLALVFPTGKEYADLATVTTPDRYSIAYLDVLTRGNPQEVELRFVYVKQLGALGRFDKAIGLLEPVLADPRHHLTAANMRFDLRLAQARSIPEDNPLRKETFELVYSDLKGLLPLPHDSARMRELAKVALELEHPELASKFLLRLADQTDEKGKAPILAEAAHWLRASGDGKSASANYDKAAGMTPDPTVGRAYALASIAALEAENAVPEAADRAAQYAVVYPKDLDILMKATQLATACSRDEAARDLGRQVLALAVEDDLPDAFLREQAKRELALHDPVTALKFIKRLVARHPNDIDLREAEAYVAEWAGELRLALRDWLFVMRHGRGSNAGRGGIRL
ncbi:tetratricopeptide repeat protein [Pendulispora albinea]|uniref:Tetratricopeptide repeat protein n=1 Tax=Pendulispora albinea TaxID=2741071 RepID=A0ABZ2LSW3_9BACT